MKTKLFLIPVLVLFAVLSFAQNISCGDNAVIAVQKNNVQNYDELVRQINLAIKERNDQLALSKTSAGPTGYVIPVVFHIVHPASAAYGTGANISYNQVVSQINALNAAFSKSYPSYNGQTHPSYAQNSTIQFCLAKTPMPASAVFYNGPGGTEYGVKRYPDNTLTNHTISNASATALKALTHPSASYFPENNYLNIWVVSSISSGGPGTVMGYAPKPLMGSYPLDGVVMRSDIIGDNSTGNSFSLGYGLQQGKVLAHEVGHYLNLMHIFEGGCAGANAKTASSDQCDLNGDMICDIEPCTTQNINCTQPIPNTCTASYTTGTTNMDMIESYMSYADDDCMNTFTSDQCSRIWATLGMLRYNLWQNSNLIATGVIGTGGCVSPFLMSTINVNPGNVCMGSAVQYSNTLSGNTATSWSWTLAGTTPSLANTSSISVTYTAAGSYWVKLSVSNGTVTSRDSVLVSVTNCVLDPAKKNQSSWQFGKYGNLSFNSGSPVAGPNSSIDTFESSASISDSTGNLLFYTDGNKVWNKNHAQMMGLGGFLKGSNYYNISASHGALIIPVPNSNKKYYIMSGAQQPAVTSDSTKRITYSIVDMNLNSGLGDIISINQFLPGPYFLPTEGQTAIPHCNGYDFWYIIHGAKTTGYLDKMAAYLITAGGISNPVISNSGFMVPAPTATTTDGYLLTIESSPDGKTIAVTDNGTLVNPVYMRLYKFDKKSGVITPTYTLPVLGAIPMLQPQFSPNSRFLYVGAGNAVTQFDLLASPTPTSTVLFNNNMNRLYFQLGPDNKIYGSTPTSTQDRLSVINFPDLPGAAASFNFNTVVLGPMHQAKIGLPNMIDAKRPGVISRSFITTPVNCNTIQFAVDSCWQMYNCSWNYGDSNTGTGLVSTHSYSAIGTYTASLVLSFGTYSFTAVNQVVNIIPSTTSVSGPSVICQGSTFLNSYGVTPISGASYSWTVNNASIVGPASLQSANVGSSGSGIATVSVQIMNGGCTIVGTKTITIDAIPTVSLIGTPSTVCLGNTLTLNGSPAGGFYSGPGVSGNIFNSGSAGSGAKQVYYTYTNSNGCSNVAAATLTVTSCVGINEITNGDNGLNVYPNPNNGEFEVNASKEMSLLITNELGQLINRVTLNKENDFSVKLEGLANGIYFIGNGSVKKKIVVIR
jgi:hypothetical protein